MAVWTNINNVIVKQGVLIDGGRNSFHYYLILLYNTFFAVHVYLSMYRILDFFLNLNHNTACLRDFWSTNLVRF